MGVISLTDKSLALLKLIKYPRHYSLECLVVGMTLALVRTDCKSEVYNEQQ